MQVAIATGASSGIGASAVMQIAKRGRGAPDLQHERIRTRDTVEAIERDGGTAAALPLDVGRSETFPAFRDAVVAAIRDNWNRDSFHFLVNDPGFGQMSMF